MSSADAIQRILFDDIDVRGVVVGLEASYQQVLARHDYPPQVQRLLGEMLAAVSLLSSTLKFEGRLFLQAQGDGPLRLLMAECSRHRQVRAVARLEGEFPQTGQFHEWLQQGQLVLTIEPAQGQRYQGVVPLERDSLAGCLEDYFAQSEQLPTSIHLAADGQQAAGLLLQVLPAAGAGNADWEHISTLASTLTERELLQLDNEALLYRLFHQEQCRLFEPQALSFFCDCSHERSANALRLLERDELLQAAQEQGGALDVTCEFCNSHYSFDETDIKALFAAGGQPADAHRIH